MDRVQRTPSTIGPDAHGISAAPLSYSQWSLFACLVGTFMLRMASAVMGSTIQLYFSYIDQHVYPLSDTMRGLALALFFLPELIGSPILGAWSDRRGRKWFMVLGAVFGGIGVQVTAMTANYGALAVMRLLGGLSTASAIPATLSYLSAMTSHSESLRGRVMGLFQIATVGGTIVGILLGGRLWDLFLQRAFTIDAVLYLVSLAVFLVGVGETRPAQNVAVTARSAIRKGWAALERTASYYRTVFSSPGVLRFAPAFLAINMILGVWLNHLVGQVVSPRYHFSNQLLYGILANDKHAGTEISMYGTFFLAVFGMGAVAWSFMLGRFRRTSVMLVTVGALFALCGVVFLLNHTARFSDPIVPVYLVLGTSSLLVLSGMMPAALTYLADVTEERRDDRGAIMGLYTIFFGVGGFLGTLLGGPFADWRAIDGILLVTVLLGLAAAVLLLRLHQTETSARFQSLAILSKEQ